MDKALLEATAEALVAPGKGILAAATRRCNQRLFRLPQTNGGQV